jgi:hypothetical protein
MSYDPSTGYYDYYEAAGLDAGLSFGGDINLDDGLQFGGGLGLPSMIPEPPRMIPPRAQRRRQIGSNGTPIN